MTAGTAATVQDVAAAQDCSAAQPAKLAEPPIPGGRIEALMGVLIRALKASPLARPLPAVSLSALGLGLLAFTGLCATAPGASEAALPVFLPLTALARRLGAPVLSADVTNIVMYPAITLCCLGLAGMLWANSRGWQPNPRRVFWTAAAAVAGDAGPAAAQLADPLAHAGHPGARAAALQRRAARPPPGALSRAGCRRTRSPKPPPAWKAEPRAAEPAQPGA